MKETHFAELWWDTVPTKAPCPQPLDPEDMVRRVNVALDGLPSERRPQMRKKTRFAAVLIAATAALVGTTLAVTYHFDVLNAFFQGDTAPAQALVDREIRSVSDENYTLTVESSVADGQSALLLVRVDALTEEAKTFLFSDDFNSMDTWSVHPVDVPERLGETSGVTGMSYKELGELRTDTSATWRFDVDLNGAAALRVRLGHMEEGAALEFNLTPAESVTVDIGATGPGAPTLYNAQGGDLTIASVTLSPLTCQVEAAMADPDREADPLFFFLMEDGTLLTSGQSTTDSSRS